MPQTPPAQPSGASRSHGTSRRPANWAARPSNLLTAHAAEAKASLLHTRLTAAARSMASPTPW